MSEEQEEKSKGGLKEFFAVSEVFTYFFKKKDSKGNFNLKAMHFINKFSIVVFLLGVLYFVSKKIFF